MSQAAHNVGQEYWRPAAAPEAGEAGPRSQFACVQCGTEFVIGSRFCHVCGSEREPLVGYRAHGWTEWLDFHHIRETLGMSIGALVAFIAGIGCVIAAIATGFIYTAATMLDWQAVQVWRMEWLLGAIAAFLAGILLNKYEGQ